MLPLGEKEVPKYDDSYPTDHNTLNSPYQIFEMTLERSF